MMYSLFFEPTCNKNAHLVKLLWVDASIDACKKELAALCGIEDIDDYIDKEDSYIEGGYLTFNVGDNSNVEKILQSCGIFRIFPVQKYTDVMKWYQECFENIV